MSSKIEGPQEETKNQELSYVLEEDYTPRYVDKISEEEDKRKVVLDDVFVMMTERGRKEQRLRVLTLCVTVLVGVGILIASIRLLKEDPNGEPTAIAEATDEVESTAVATDTSVFTETPVTTLEATVTPKIEKTKKPKKTAKPKKPKKPARTKRPEKTARPQVTGKPVFTAKPKQTKKPEKKDKDDNVFIIEE